MLKIVVIFVFHHLMKFSLICDGAIKMSLDCCGVRFLGCVTLYFCRFPYGGANVVGTLDGILL